MGSVAKAARLLNYRLAGAEMWAALPECNDDHYRLASDQNCRSDLNRPRQLEQGGDGENSRSIPSAALVIAISSYPWCRNPKVAGSNPASATRPLRQGSEIPLRNRKDELLTHFMPPYRRRQHLSTVEYTL